MVGALLLWLWAADWPAFRGTNGAGVQATASKLPVEFGPGKSVAWTASLPYGSSSPVLAGDRLWVTGTSGSELITFCLDKKSGRELWRRSIKRPREQAVHALNDPASPTPVTDGANVVVFFAEFGLVSYGPDGKERWRHPLGPFRNMFGMAASPVLAGDRVVLVCDQQSGSFAVAVDAKTGKQAWRRERPEAGIGWALPVVYQPSGGERQVIVTGNRSVEGYSVVTGERLWRRRLVADASNGAPALLGNTLFVNAAGYDQPWMPSFEAMAVKLDANKDGLFQRPELMTDPETGGFFEYFDDNGDGAVSKAEWDTARMAGVGEYGLMALTLGANGDLPDKAVQWRMKRNLPYVPAPLLYQDVLYLAKNGGIVTTVDPRTGAILKQGRAGQAGGEYYASPVAGDGKVYLTTKEGKVAVLRAEAQWEVLAVNDMGEECMATPALDEDSLYVRTRSKLIRFRK